MEDPGLDVGLRIGKQATPFDLLRSHPPALVKEPCWSLGLFHDSMEIRLIHTQQYQMLQAAESMGLHLQAGIVFPEEYKTKLGSPQ